MKELRADLQALGEGKTLQEIEREKESANLAIEKQQIDAARENFFDELTENETELTPDQKRTITNFVNDYIKEGNPLTPKNLDDLKIEAQGYIRTMIKNNTAALKGPLADYTPTGKEEIIDYLSTVQSDQQ